jgi:hypothetical protein
MPNKQGVSVSIEIKKNEFKKIIQKYPGLVSQVIRKTAQDIITFAAPLTPVDTGYLRMAVTTVVFSEFLVGVYWSANYAVYQNYGTRYIAGHFFADKATEQARSPFIEAIKAIQML